jgi:hypothetical protein
MLMALFQVAAGREAVFFVVPLVAGVAIGATYLLGAAVGGPWIGLAAASLLAASPSFLFQLTSSPMSDIPVTAWWALALAAVLFEGRRAAFGAGVAAGAAVLTRANLVPLAVIPAVWLLREVRASRSVTGVAAQRLALYSIGVVAACITVAVLYDYWYGSPFRSGYGDVGGLYGWENLPLNLARYPRWLLASQTPVVVLGLALPLLIGATRAAGELRARAFTLLAFIGLVFGSYALRVIRCVVILALPASCVPRIAGPHQPFTRPDRQAPDAAPRRVRRGHRRRTDGVARRAVRTRRLDVQHGR